MTRDGKHFIASGASHGRNCARRETPVAAPHDAGAAVAELATCSEDTAVAGQNLVERVPTDPTIGSRPKRSRFPGSAVPTRRQLRLGAAVLGIKLATALLVLLLQVSLARHLGHTAFGEYAYVFAWMQLLFIVGRGGLDTASLRYVAHYRVLGDWAHLAGFLRRSSQYTFVLSALAGLLLAVGATIAHSRLSGGVFVSFLIAGVTLPVLAQVTLGSAALRGLGSVPLSMLADFARPLIMLFAIQVVGYFFESQWSAATAMLLQLFTTCAVLALVLRLQHRLQRRLVGTTPRRYSDGEWMLTGVNLMVATGLVYLQGRTGVVVTGLFLSAEDAGTYAALERLADAVLLGMASVDIIGAPKIAELYAQNRMADLQYYSRLLAWGATGFMAIAVSGLVFVGKPMLGLFGEGFAAAYPALLVLLGGTAINAMCGSVYYLLNMTGNHRLLAAILAGSLLVNILLSLALVPVYGVLGTAYANAAAIVFWKLGMLAAVRIRLGIWPNIGRVRSNFII